MEIKRIIVKNKGNQIEHLKQKYFMQIPDLCYHKII